MSELHYASVDMLSNALRRRSISPVALVSAILARIEKLDRRFGSYLTIAADVALQAARAAEIEIAAGIYRGPLHGIPFAAKDICDTKDIPTSRGMAQYRNFIPGDDATVIRRLKQAGAILLGKLHTTEGATAEYDSAMPPAPVNPWNEELWAGISSSGSGVATAAGLCTISLGSDTGGSIRFPSACNSITGLKPTWGLVSRYGIFANSESRDVVGPMARSAADVAAMLTAIAGNDPKDPTSAQNGPVDYTGELSNVYGARNIRIGIDWDFNNSGAEPEMVACIKAAAHVLEDLGAELIDIRFPDAKPVIDSQRHAMLAETAHAHAAAFSRNAADYSQTLRNRVEAGMEISGPEVAAASLERSIMLGQFSSIFANVDIILLPIFPDGTPTIEEMKTIMATDIYKWFKFTLQASMTGLPSLSFPCGFTRGGRPIGTQLMGPAFSEAALLRVVHAYQQATDWHTHHPLS